MNFTFDGKKYGTRLKPGDHVKVVSSIRFGYGVNGNVRQIGYNPDHEQIEYEVVLEDGGRGLYSANELMPI